MVSEKGMFTFTDTQLLQWLADYFFPFCRIGAFFMAVPVIGTQLVSVRVRLVLAATITILAVPLLPPLNYNASFSLETLLIVIQQVLIGLAMGFLMQVVFQMFVMAGQFVAMKMGLGFAQMNDPGNGVSVTVISQFYLMLSTMLFLSLNGHLILINVLVESFASLPVVTATTVALNNNALWEIVAMGSWMFERALLVALPVLTSLLVVNLAFGVMSRAAPQMNVFTVGFPITLVFGLILIWMGLVNFLPNYQSFMDEGFRTLRDVAGLP